MSETEHTTPDANKEPPPAPEWAAKVPEKFRRETLEESLDAWNKSHSELEGKLRTRPTGGSDLTLGRTEPTAAPRAVESWEDLLKGSGLNRDEVDAYFTQHGKLSDGHIKAIAEKKGIGKGLINEFVAGRMAQAELNRSRAASARAAAERAAGGPDKLGTMIEWANDPANFSEQDKVLFNSLVGPGATETSAEAAITLIKTAQARKMGSSGGTITSGNTPSSASGGFTSIKELRAAVKTLNEKHLRGDDDPALAKRIAATSDSIRSEL